MCTKKSLNYLIFPVFQGVPDLNARRASDTRLFCQCSILSRVAATICILYGSFFSSPESDCGVYCLAKSAIILSQLFAAPIRMATPLPANKTRLLFFIHTPYLKKENNSDLVKYNIFISPLLEMFVYIIPYIMPTVNDFSKIILQVICVVTPRVVRFIIENVGTPFSVSS